MPAVHRCESCKGEVELMIGGKNYSAVFNVLFYILTLIFGIIIHNICKSYVNQVLLNVHRHHKQPN